jgi:hypothetical protein
MKLGETDIPWAKLGKERCDRLVTMAGIQSMSAPLDEDVALQVTDGRGGPYTLQ